MSAGTWSSTSAELQLDTRPKASAETQPVQNRRMGAGSLDERLQQGKIPRRPSGPLAQIGIFPRKMACFSLKRLPTSPGRSASVPRFT